MKRHRDYDEILHEREEAYKRASALFSEMYDHPEHKKREQEKKKLKLQTQLPPLLIPILCDELGLKSLEMNRELEENSRGNPAYIWHFSAEFKNEEFTCEVELDTNDSVDDFQPIDFHQNPIRLWHRALDENDDEVGPALAAFCFVCCERLGDYDAEPTKAFRVPIGKNEVK